MSSRSKSKSYVSTPLKSNTNSDWLRLQEYVIYFSHIQSHPCITGLFYTQEELSLVYQVRKGST